MTNIGITGIGIVSAIGHHKEAFKAALFNKHTHFSWLNRAGRTYASQPSFVGAEISESTLHDLADYDPQKMDFSSSLALITLAEAWKDAGLKHTDPEKITLIVAGSNIKQRDQLLLLQRHLSKPFYTAPHYAMTFLDSDIGGLCTAHFGIKGGLYTLGAASASAQVAVIQAMQQVFLNKKDVVIVLAPMQDLSCFELQALRNIGAMGTERYFLEPDLAYRPFDKKSEGFIFGEACAALVIEHVKKPRVRCYAELVAGTIVSDANRNPNPSLESEIAVIKKTLKQARLSPKEIDYVNPHGSGSQTGDNIEIQALRHCKLNESYINTTKSLCGHTLSAAGAIEIIATVLQMESNTLHGSNNLDEPIATDFNWVFEKKINEKIQHALSLSFGFSGINSALCLRNHLI